MTMTTLMLIMMAMQVMMVEETVYDGVVECDHSYDNDYINDDNDGYVGDDGRGDGVGRCSGVRSLL